MTRLDSTIESALLLWMRKAIGKINCQQGIYFDVAPTAGTWTVTLDAVTSGAIQWNATNTDVEVALEAMSNIDSVTVTGNFTDGFEVEFDGSDQYTDFNLFTVDISGLITTTSAKVWKHQEGRDGFGRTQAYESFRLESESARERPGTESPRPPPLPLEPPPRWQASRPLSCGRGQSASIRTEGPIGHSPWRYSPLR